MYIYAAGPIHILYGWSLNPYPYLQTPYPYGYGYGYGYSVYRGPSRVTHKLGGLLETCNYIAGFEYVGTYAYTTTVYLQPST
jgi:hypothetical protein